MLVSPGRSPSPVPRGGGAVFIRGTAVETMLFLEMEMDAGKSSIQKRLYSQFTQAACCGTPLLPPPPSLSPKHDQVGCWPDLPVHDPSGQKCVVEVALCLFRYLGGTPAVEHGRVADEADDRKGGVHELIDDALFEDLLDARPVFFVFWCEVVVAVVAVAVAVAPPKGKQKTKKNKKTINFNCRS